MSPNQKRLKFVCFAIMFVGLLEILAGAFLISGSPLAAGMRIPVGDAAYDGMIAAEVLGAVGVVAGVYCLCVGASGARVANSPRKIGAFRTLDIVLVLVAVVEFALGVMSGQLPWVEALIAILGIVALLSANAAHNELLD